MRASVERSLSRALVGAALVGLVAAGCDGAPTASEEERALAAASHQPELAAFGGGILPWEYVLVTAELAGSETPLSPQEYLVVTVETSAGDVEALRLRRAFREDGRYARRLVVTPARGVTLQALDSRIRNAGAAVIEPWLVYAVDAVEDVKRRLLLYPGIAAVEPWTGNLTGIVDLSIGSAAILDGALQPTPDAPVPGDGKLSVGPGVSVFFRYTSSSGNVYTHTREFPPVPPSSE